MLVVLRTPLRNETMFVVGRKRTSRVASHSVSNVTDQRLAWMSRNLFGYRSRHGAFLGDSVDIAIQDCRVDCKGLVLYRNVLCLVCHSRCCKGFDGFPIRPRIYGRS